MKKTLTFILSMLLCFTAPALAQDAEKPLPDDGDAAVVEAQLEDVALNRSIYTADIMAAWGADPEIASQLQLALMLADDAQILAALEAVSFEQVEAVLFGNPVAAGDLEGPAAIGSTSSDLTYTPVTPCRIIDTRLPTPNPLTGGVAREYYVYGSLSFQGGGTCNSPVGEPSGVHIAITVIPVQTGGGNLRVYPANISTPLAAVLNYTHPTTIANSVTVKTYRAAGREIEFWASKNVHLIVDVMGYYSPPARTLPDTWTGYTSSTVASGSWKTLYSPYCPSGYRMTGGGHYTSALRYMNVVESRPISTGYNRNNRWYVWLYNYDGGTRTIRSYINCLRIPGR